MKSRVASIILTMLIYTGATVFITAPARAGGSFLKVPVSISYSSIYWWRGVEINGKGVGVMWPSVGLEFGETGLTLLVAAGLNTDYFVANKSGDRDAAKAYHEMDYGASYTINIGKVLSIGGGVMYVHYPFYDASNSSATDPSFVEGSLSIWLKSTLNPKLELYYDYYVEDNGNPQNEDYYVKFSVKQEIAKEGAFSLFIGAWAAYYNNAYLDATGFSDAGVKLGLSQDYKGVGFFAGVYYARSLSSDFYREFDPDGDGNTSKVKNHFWADIGVSYIF